MSSKAAVQPMALSHKKRLRTREKRRKLMLDHVGFPGTKSWPPLWFWQLGPALASPSSSFSSSRWSLLIDRSRAGEVQYQPNAQPQFCGKANLENINQEELVLYCKEKLHDVMNFICLLLIFCGFSMISMLILFIKAPALPNPPDDHELRWDKFALFFSISCSF